MKRSLTFVLSLVLLLAVAMPLLSPAARAASEITMTAISVPPVIDGIIDDVEWGERACTVDPFSANRTNPTFSTSGPGYKRPTQIDYWFRYDARYIYIAVRVTTNYFYYSDEDFRDGTYLVPRVDTDGDAVANYLGLIAIESDGEVATRDNLLSSMSFHLVGARPISGGVEYEIAYSRHSCTVLDGKLDLDLDFYTPDEGIVYFRETITVSDEDAVPLDPSRGDPADVLPLTEPVVFDGIAGEGEWGKPGLSLSKKVSGGGRNYCCDYYNGQGLGIPDMDFFWRHDGEYLYLAVQVGENRHAGTSTFTFDDKLVLYIGEKAYVVYLENKQARSAQIPKKDLGFRYADGIAFFEMRVPLSEIDGGAAVGDTFLGYVEYYNSVITTTEEGGTLFSGILTRSVPSFVSGGAPANAFTLK